MIAQLSPGGIAKISFISCRAREKKLEIFTTIGNKLDSSRDERRKFNESQSAHTSLAHHQDRRSLLLIFIYFRFPSSRSNWRTLKFEKFSTKRFSLSVLTDVTVDDSTSKKRELMQCQQVDETTRGKAAKNIRRVWNGLSCFIDSPSIDAVLEFHLKTKKTWSKREQEAVPLCGWR